MKKIILGISLSLALAISTTQANAEDGFGFDPYVGMGIGSLVIKQTGQLSGPPGNSKFPDDVQLYGYAAMGAHLHKYFDIEMRVGTTKADATTAAPTANARRSADYVFSGFAKPKVYMTETALIYGLIGGTTARYVGNGVGTAAANTAVGAKTVSGFSFGVGLEYKASEHFSIGGDAVRYLHKVTATPPTPNELTLDSYTLFVKYGF